MRAAPLAFLILAFATNFLYAQADEDLRHFTLSTWTTEQGLPQNFITAIDQTPDGFLWIGTRGGLARFDGLSFRTTFTHEPAAIHSVVNDIAHDRSGRLWVTTSLGLLCEAHGRWSQIALPAGHSVQPGPLFLSHDGSLLVGIGEAVWRLDPQTLRFTQVPGVPGKLRSFTEDAHHNLWLTDSEAVVEIAPDGSNTRYPLPDAAFIRAASDGRIYVGDGHHLFRFEKNRFVSVPNSGTEEFVDMTIARDGALWMAAGGLEGLSRKTGNNVQRLSMREGLASNDVRLLYEDRNGAMWLGTISGLQRLRRGAFVSYRDEGLPPFTAQYDAIFQAADRSIWTGTLQDGISVFRNGKWKTYGTEAGVRRGQVRGFVEDGAMPMVTIADYGIFRWSGAHYAKIPGIPAGYVTSPMRMTDGSLWFSIARQGVFRLRNGKLQHFGTAQGLTDAKVWCLLPDRDGNGLYAGSNSGIFHFENGLWKQVFPEIHEAVLTLAYNGAGELLAGTNTGFARLRRGDVKTVGRSQGLLSDPVLQLVEDAERSVWIATAAGLSRIPAEQMEAFLSGRSAAVVPQLYTDRDGLPSRDLLPTSHVLGLKARDGRLWFAMSHGPTSGNALPEAPPVAMHDDIILDGVVQPDETVRVPPGRHRLTFSFTAPSFDAPEMIHFRYRLVGWDSGWIDAGSLRQATYAGLPPGHFSFEVQAIGRGGTVGPIARIPNVDLLPFFWQTRWFVALASLLAIAITIEFTRRRTMLTARRMHALFQERAAERERIAYLIHDTVIQDLIGATLYLEIAEMELATGEVELSKPLEGLAARLRESIARSRNMVANLHATSVPEHGILDVLRLAEAEFRLAAEPAFRLSYTGEPRSVDPLLRDEIYRVCREAIANAFRHANARNIHVHVEFSPTSLAVKIADDGIGMDSALQQTGRTGHFGLHAMRAHAERIGAAFSIESVAGKGTIVRLRSHTFLRTRVWSCVRDLRRDLFSRLSQLRSRRDTL